MRLGRAAGALLALGLAIPLTSAAPGAKPRVAPPRPPWQIWAVRVGPGVIGVEWGMRRGRAKPPYGFILHRADKPQGPYREIARRPAERMYFLDAKIKPQTVYFYKVAAFSDLAGPSALVGPACAWDSDQIMPNGSFELDAHGLIPIPKCPLGWSKRAYRTGTAVVVKPGGPDGEQCVEIRATNASDGGGLHSALIPMVENETWRQEAWVKAMPGARPRVGRCFHDEKRRPLRATREHGRAYGYAGTVESRPDGWSKRAETFTAYPSTGYVQIWLIGHRACNTFWLDGAKVFDLTAQRARKTETEPFRRDAALLLQTSVATRKRKGDLTRIDGEIDQARERMRAELDVLTPLAYRRLFVALHRLQREYVDLVWEFKTLALLED